MNLIDVTRELGTQEQCLAYLEKARWPKGVRCLACESEKISKFTTKEGVRKLKNGTTRPVPARHLYQCLECGRQFSATVGTIFNDSHLPLTLWFLAIALMLNGKKGISAKQMERDLGITYRTAWYLHHRIRKAMNDGIEGLLSGTVETDETYVGGRYDKRRGRDPFDKEMVFGMLERTTPERPSRIKLLHVTERPNPGLRRIVNSHVAKGSVIYTDQANRYRKLSKDGYQHDKVNHIFKEWVRGEVHTNGIENFWSLFKRGLIGSFHRVSVKHLARYAGEFAYRFNNREVADLFALTVVGLLIQSALPYRKLTADQSEAG